MTAGARHDLSTRRAQAVVPGQIRGPVPTATTEVGQRHEAYEWATTRCIARTSTIEE